MTPKEQAKELTDKFYNQLLTATPRLYRIHYQSNKLAIICVDVILNIYDNLKNQPFYIYWEDVKKELKKK